jgi:hypothetical protein
VDTEPRSLNTVASSTFVLTLYFPYAAYCSFLNTTVYYGDNAPDCLLWCMTDSMIGIVRFLVDHIRVFDTNTGANNDLECLDVLDRILDVLDKNPGKYQFVNISAGPQFAITDDEVTPISRELTCLAEVEIRSAHSDAVLVDHA